MRRRDDAGPSDPDAGNTVDGGLPPSAALYQPPRRYEIDLVDGEITYTSTDALFTAERTIPLRVRTPRGATGALPAVIVIHGGGFDDRGHTKIPDWGAVVATSGYVAINFGNSTDEAGAHCQPLGIPIEDCDREAFERPVSEGGTLGSWFYTRPRDASAILDQLAYVEELAGVTIDRDRLGVLGWSAGAHATMLLAGATVDVSPSVHEMPSRDERFRAYVANSPQGVDQSGWTESSWGGVAVPMLVQTGSRDGNTAEDIAGRLHPFNHLNGPDVYQSFIEDETATHDLFGLTQDTPGVVGTELYVASAAVAFLDAYVLERPEARAWLQSGALDEVSEGVATLSFK